MKKLILTIFLVSFFVSDLAFAANSAVALDSLPLTIGGRTSGKVIPVIVTIDTINEDLEIFEPAEGYAVGIVGIELVKTAAFNLTVTNGENTPIILEIPAGGGWSKSVDNNVKFPGNIDESLYFASSVALTAFIVYVVEYKNIQY